MGDFSHLIPCALANAADHKGKRIWSTLFRSLKAVVPSLYLSQEMCEISSPPPLFDMV